MIANLLSRDFSKVTDDEFRSLSVAEIRFCLTMLQRRPSLRVIHALLTWVAAWWAGVLAMPGDTFATSPAYRLFSVVMTEDQWAFTLAVVAVIGLVGLVWKRMRIASAHVLSITHGFLAGLIALAVPFSTGAGVYAGLAVIGYYFLWQQRGITGGNR